jgi:hypothetical protein
MVLMNCHSSPHEVAVHSVPLVVKPDGSEHVTLSHCFDASTTAKIKYPSAPNSIAVLNCVDFGAEYVAAR